MSLAPEPTSGERRIAGGRYLLTEKIGGGGLGVVWKAVDNETGRVVAVKELRATMVPESARGTVHQRVEREVSAAKALAGHPNVVAVLDEFWEDGRRWIVMEYVSGPSLQQIIGRDGPVPPWRAARIGLDLLNALDAAHEAGILHRDVKPSNVLIAEDGRALLSDFGIAQIQNDSALTVTGEIVGSPGYIAPERLAGRPASRASDLWSLGATLYAAVEGHMPHQHGTAWATMNAAMHDTVPPPLHAGPLEPVLSRLLDRDPAVRIGSVEVRELLDGIVVPEHGPMIEGVELGSKLGDATWRARDREGRELVVRRIRTGEEALFKAAQTLARMPLDGVVKVREVGESGLPYIVMEYADRGTLAHRARGEPADVLGEIVKVARQVAALSEAGVHYQVLAATQILFQSTDDGGERVLLPIPVPRIRGDEPRDSVIALLSLVSWSVGQNTAFAMVDEDIPDAAAFAEALESAIETLKRRPADMSGLPDPPPLYEPVSAASENGTEVRPPPPPLIGSGGPAGEAPSGAASMEGRPRTSASRVPSYVLHSPLRDTFRYVHEPLRPGDEAIPLLGNESLIKALKERLVNSAGGAFLITGFRGAGKSTLIEQALAQIKEQHPRGRRVLPVVLSVARPLEIERLLFAIIRRVFEELVEAKVLDRLPPETRRSLVTAYMRTSLSFKETRSDATERTSSVDFAPAKLARGMLGPVGVAIPKAGMSSKRSRSLATEAAFLAYSETDVEHDMTRIIRLLSEVPERTRGRWRRKPLDLQLVIVLDEVDKLTAVKNGLEKVEELLSGIKNVVTMRGAHYLVVAGPDLHDRVLRDSGRGNSIYESIFAWQLYVPCNWEAPWRLLRELCPPEMRRTPIFGEFSRYLGFKSRGVPRKLLQELNAFVVWEDGHRPFLRIENHHTDAILFYAELDRTLDDFFTATDRRVPPTPLSRDRWRLGAYYVTEWILRTEGRPFTSADVVQENEAFDPLLRVSRSGVDRLLEHLHRKGVLAAVRAPDQATSTLVSDVAAAQHPSYRLESAVLERLFGILAHNEYEREEFGASRALPGGAAPIETLANDRYELLELIGEGGTSTVYAGVDTLLRRPVAVKLLRTALRTDARARGRFLREATIAGVVHHPNVVDVYEVVTVPAADDPGEQRYAIVMELVEGKTLDATIRSGPLPAREVAEIGTKLAGALDYLAGKGLARLDLKPHNIVIHDGRGPVIIDLGIAKIVENAEAWLIDADEPAGLANPSTRLGIVVGTPAYLSPEQARGEEIDIRSDIYALGLVLCTCLAGRHPYQDLDAVAVMARAMEGRRLDTSGLPCSPELRAVLGRATEPDRERRYDRPAELVAALRATPESS